MQDLGREAWWCWLDFCHEAFIRGAICSHRKLHVNNLLTSLKSNAVQGTPLKIETLNLTT